MGGKKLKRKPSGELKGWPTARFVVQELAGASEFACKPCAVHGPVISLQPRRAPPFLCLLGRGGGRVMLREIYQHSEACVLLRVPSEPAANVLTGRGLHMEGGGGSPKTTNTIPIHELNAVFPVKCDPGVFFFCDDMPALSASLRVLPRATQVGTHMFHEGVFQTPGGWETA